VTDRRGPRLGKTLEVLAKVYGKEPSRNPGKTPLDHLVYGIIAGNSPQQKARAAFQDLQDGYVDWNELRIAESREIVEHLEGLGEREDLYARAELLRRTLQSLFDARDTVRIELEEKAEPGAVGEEQEVVRALGTVPGLSPGLVAAVMARAVPEPPIRLTSGIARVAQRIGIIPRSGGEAKQAAVLGSAAGDRDSRILLHFLLGEHAERVCLPKGPACDTCPCLEFCEFGKRRGAES
jgi:endonuclease III